MDYSLAVLFLCAFVLSLLLTPVCRNAALRLNLVDRPDGARKLHRKPVPHVGGIPILLSIAAASVCLTFLPWGGTRFVTEALRSHWPILAAMTLVFLTGLVDDLAGLTPRHKLLGLILAAGLACAGGIRINSIGPLHISVWLAIPITILWLVGCATAFNLIDGLDGLATGVALLAMLGTLISANLVGLGSHYLLALALVPMAGALLGFLPYNFSPASIFLGDSGSLMIGFLLGSSSVLWSQKSPTFLGTIAPVMALSIPLLDVALSIARRFLRGKPIFSADRGHIHHRLLDLGFSPRNAALLLYGACLLSTAFAVALTVAPSQIGISIIALFSIAAWLGIRSLGYSEFVLATRLMIGGTFRRSLNAHLNVRTVENSLRAADSVDECWAALCEACRIFGFAEARFKIADQVLHKRFRALEAQNGWDIRVPLPNGDYINFTRPLNSTSTPVGVAPLLDMVRQVMAEKCLTYELVPTRPTMAPVYEIQNHRPSQAFSD